MRRGTGYNYGLDCMGGWWKGLDEEFIVGFHDWQLASPHVFSFILISDSDGRGGLIHQPMQLMRHAINLSQKKLKFNFCDAALGARKESFPNPTPNEQCSDCSVVRISETFLSL